MFKKAFIFLVQTITLITIVIFFSCNRLWGDHPLGNNFSLLKGDCKEDMVIVFCSKGRGICQGGIFVVPTYERHMLNGNYAEYVEDAEANKRWIVAKTFQIIERKQYYWIIDKDNIDCEKNYCDSIIQSHVTGPLNLNDFKGKVRALNIDIEFE